MKKKIIAIALIGAILSVIIYFFTKSDELTIVSIGDGLSLGMTPYGIEGKSFNDYLKEDYEHRHKLKEYIHEFANSGKTVKELIYEIKENTTLVIKEEEIEIQQAINEADILTISIGMDELANKRITNQIKNEYLEDLEELLSMIKMLNNKKVIVVSLYTWGRNDLLTIEKLNASIRDIALSNNFLFVDINKILLNKEYYLSEESYYINYIGHKMIYNEIKKLVTIHSQNVSNTKN